MTFHQCDDQTAAGFGEAQLSESQYRVVPGIKSNQVACAGKMDPFAIAECHLTMGYPVQQRIVTLGDMCGTALQTAKGQDVGLLDSR